MSETLGPIAFGTGHDEVFLGKEYGTIRNYSELTASEIDNEINRIITNAYNRGKEILSTMFTSCTLLRTPFLSLRKSAARTLRDSWTQRTRKKKTKCLNP